MDVPIVIADFDARPWSAAVLDAVVARLDAICEETRQSNPRCRQAGLGAWLWVPAQLAAEADAAMRRVFAPRLDREDGYLRPIGSEPIDAEWLRDPMQLIFAASAHVAAGRVKLGEGAAKRSRGMPLLGVLSVRPGEAVDGDALRVALLLGVTVGLDAEPSHMRPAIPSARVEFG